MRKGDGRIRYLVEADAFTRQMRATMTLELFDGERSVDVAGPVASDILFEGRSVADWVRNGWMRFLGMNAVTNGDFRWDANFTEPVQFSWPGGGSRITRIVSRVTLDGAWFEHRIRLDSTAGFFDWLRKVIIFPNGAISFELQGLDFYGGKLVLEPPADVLEQSVQATLVQESLNVRPSSLLAV